MSEEEIQGDMGDQFKCGLCHNIFHKCRAYEDCKKEAKMYGHDADDKEMVYLCIDCYEKVSSFYAMKN